MHGVGVWHGVKQIFTMPVNLKISNVQFKCTLRHSSCNYTTRYCNLQYNCSLWIRVTHQEPLVLALEVAHTHDLQPSIHSHWDLKTYSAQAASSGFGDRQGKCVVQLCPSSGIEYLVWGFQCPPSVRTGCI